MSGIVQRRVKDRTLPVPSLSAASVSLFELSRQLHLDLNERAIAASFLDVISNLFPRRILGVRVLDPRLFQGIRGYNKGGEYHPDAFQTLLVNTAELTRAQLKTPLKYCSLITESEEWLPPFSPACTGFSILLTAKGELFGALDVGFPLGREVSASEQDLFEPFANILALSLSSLFVSQRLSSALDDYGAICNGTQNLVVSLNNSLQINSCNHRFAEVAGRSRSSLVGTDFREIIPEGIRPAISNLLSDLATGMPLPTSLSFPLMGNDRSFEWNIAGKNAKRMLLTASPPQPTAENSDQ